jgi:ubiquinol-cytochrome c reductase cytochrome c subunit
VKRLVLLAAVVLLLPASAAAEPSGRQLFAEGCASCHGLDARGIPGTGPDLHGVGEASADFYLRTGRMPLVRYIGSLGGPGIPEVHPERGDLSGGQHAFTTYCAGCHQIMGEGGVVTGAVPPPLKESSPRDLAEAVRVGPYVMPAFDEEQIDQHALDSIALYVEDVVKRPPDRGGWGIGHIGPIPEGMIAWLLAGTVLLLVARVIGERIK